MRFPFLFFLSNIHVRGCTHVVGRQDAKTKRREKMCRARFVMAFGPAFRNLAPTTTLSGIEDFRADSGLRTSKKPPCSQETQSEKIIDFIVLCGENKRVITVLVARNGWIGCESIPPAPHCATKRPLNPGIVKAGRKLRDRNWPEKARDMVDWIGKTEMRHISSYIRQHRKERLAIGDRSDRKKPPPSRRRVVNGYLTTTACKT